MKRKALAALALVAAGLLSGCDAAPSTPIAPDVPPPDTSKISQEDIDRFHRQESARGADHPPSAPR